MNVGPSPVPTPSNSKDGVENPAGTTPGRLRRIVAVITMLLMLSAGGMVTAGAASASTDATGTVCFRHDTGAVYTYDVFAQTYSNGQWINVDSTRSVDGCSTWTLAPGYYIKFQAFYRVGNATFIGNSGSALIESGTEYTFQTEPVTMVKY